MIYLLFVAGLVCLIKGGGWLVDGASGIATQLRLPKLLIGATVVAVCTTLPEVMVSATSAMSGHSQTAYGNAVGSVICNVAFIAALIAAIHPSRIDAKPLLTPCVFFFIAAVIFSVPAYISGGFNRYIGATLLCVMVAYFAVTVFQMRLSMKQDINSSDKEPQGESVCKLLALLIFGVILIIVGAELIVENGTKIAQLLGVPEAVIALTMVAFGTSLPELITAITAVIKHQSSLSLGNIIGANFLNLAFVSGISITVSPFQIPSENTIGGFNASLVIDLPVMFLVMMILISVPLFRGKLSRWQGLLLLTIYVAFCAMQFIFS